MDQNIKTTLEAGGILVATIDMPGRPMNVFSESLIDSVDHLVDRVAADPEITGVVITSAKSTFLVGADLEMVLGFTRAAATQSQVELHDLCGRLGRLFRRLEESRKPYVAAINGLALGGGLELALGCHLRVVSDAPGVQLGLPEAEQHMQAAARRAAGSIDMRAALASLSWARGDEQKAEELWGFACERINSGVQAPGGPSLDGCALYRDDTWVRTVRRWPPLMADKLADFVALRHR